MKRKGLGVDYIVRDCHDQNAIAHVSQHRRYRKGKECDSLESGNTLLRTTYPFATLTAAIINDSCQMMKFKDCLDHKLRCSCGRTYPWMSIDRREKGGGKTRTGEKTKWGQAPWLPRVFDDWHHSKYL